MPVTSISFNKPSDPYLGEGLNASGAIPSYYLEMDVDNDYNVKSLLQVQGGTADDVTLSVDSKYATLSSSGYLTAIKQTKGANLIPMFPDHIILGAKAKSGSAAAFLLVRIYDAPTSLQLVQSFPVNGKNIPTNYKVLKSTGLEVKPGESFDIHYKVIPSTAQQVVRLYSPNKYMMSNIENMAIKDTQGNGMGCTTFTFNSNAYPFVGVSQINTRETAEYGTKIISKRAPSGAYRFVFCEIIVHVVEYSAQEPKPLDLMTMSMPGGFKYSVGGRIGTIDGGLRIRKDPNGRSLIRDTYKNLLPQGSKIPYAIVFEMSDDGRFPHRNGIEFTYYWDDVNGYGVPYEPSGTSKYKTVHGYAIAIHPYGKSVRWSDYAARYDYSTNPCFQLADDVFGKRTCVDEDGMRLTAHYHYFNRAQDSRYQIKPVQLLNEYHERYPTIKYMAYYSNGDSFAVPSWFLPSATEILKLEFKKNTDMRQALAERLTYYNGNSIFGFHFWSCSLYKENLALPHYAVWDGSKIELCFHRSKTDTCDFRPFHRF